MSTPNNADGLPMQSIMVYSEADGRKFKMVMRGELNRLSVDKIKRYLEKSTSVPPAKQVLTYNGKVLLDDMIGQDFDLQPNATLRLAFAQEGDPGTTAAQQSDRVQSQIPNRFPRDGDASTRTPVYDDRSSSNGGDIGGGGYRPLAEDAEGRRRQMNDLGNKPKPTSLGASHEQLFDRAARLSRMTGSPGSGVSPGPGGYTQHRQSDSYSTQHMSPGVSRGGASMGVVDAQHPLATKLAAIEEENRALREELETLKRQQIVANQLKPTSQQQLLTHAKNMLSELGKELGMHLSFDTNMTCVVGTEERNTIIVTCDMPTERLYIYSTIASSIPEDPHLRMTLYEALLEGAMLGRDMAGGGCGITLSTGLVMMSTSIALRHSDVTALRETAPVFVESLLRWRNIISDLLNSYGEDVRSHSQPHRAAPAPPRGYDGL